METSETIRQILIELTQIDEKAPIRILLRELDSIHSYLQGVPNLSDGDDARLLIHGYLRGTSTALGCSSGGRRLLNRPLDRLDKTPGLPLKVLYYLISVAHLAIFVGEDDVQTKIGMDQLVAITNTMLHCAPAYEDLPLVSHLSTALTKLQRKQYATPPLNVVRSRISLLAD